MNPTTICSGFQRCGVYPFNPGAIDCSVNIINPEASLQQVPARSEAESHNGRGSQQQAITVSPEKLERFQRRLRKEFDIPDEEYMRWL